MPNERPQSLIEPIRTRRRDLEEDRGEVLAIPFEVKGVLAPN